MSKNRPAVTKGLIKSQCLTGFGIKKNKTFFCTNQNTDLTLPNNSDSVFGCCPGDLFDDEEMLDWLTDPTTMEISDQIEKVNKKMFEKLIARNEFLTVFFCK